MSDGSFPKAWDVSRVDQGSGCSVLPLGQATAARGAPDPPWPAETSLRSHTGHRNLGTELPWLSWSSFGSPPSRPQQCPAARTTPEPDPKGSSWQLSVNNWNSVIQSHEDSSYHLSLAFLLNILTPTTIRASCKSPLKSLEIALRFLQRLLPHRDDKQPAFPKTQPDPFGFWTKIHPPGSPCPRSVLAATSRSCARSCVPLPRAAHSQGWHFTGSAAF